MMPSRQQPRPRTRASRTLATCALLVLGAVSLEAQTLNPRLVEFDPSADHSATWSDGQPKVSRYDLEVYQQGASAPFHTVNMGKPSPQSDGRVRFDFSSQVAAWPLPGGTYLAKVSAVGPTGTGRSDASNTFTFGTTSSPAPTCSFSLAPSGATVSPNGGAGSFVVSSTSGCGWTATSSASWLKVTAATGAGSGTVSYSVAANASTSARTASVSIGGQKFTVNQGGASTTTAPCSHTVSPQAFEVGAAGGAASVSVTTSSGCSWTASSSSEWIVVAADSGSGNGTVPFSVAPNDSLVARKGAIAVSGQVVAISQAGSASATCSIAVSPGSHTVPAAGGSGTFAVATSPGCAWTVGAAAPWLRISPSSGTGSGSVGFTADPNPDAAARSALVDVAGRTATVAQEGRTCRYTLSAITFRLAAEGGPAQVTVSTSAGCAWTVVSSAGWLVPSVDSGTGTADIRFDVKRNWAASPKTGTLTIGSETLTVTVDSGVGPGAPKNFRITVAR